MENKDMRLDWYDDAAEINKMAADVDEKETKLLEAGLKSKLATGLGAAVLAGSVASKEPAKLTGLPGKEPIVATRELSGKRKDEESHPYAEYKIEKRGEHKKKQVLRSKDESTLPLNAAEGIDIHLGDIGDLSSKWGTESGKEFLDSIVSAYANFNMMATFNHIVVTINVVPHGMIKTRCRNPNTGEIFNTEYACTVNPDTALVGVGKKLIPLYDALSRTGEYSGSANMLPCFDDGSLQFTIYFSEKLTDMQRAELLVHELKHCIIIYAFIQKLASIIVQYSFDRNAKQYIDGMTAGKFNAINDALGKALDNAEQFDPDSTFKSTFDMMGAIMRVEELVPIRGNVR